MVTRWIRRWLAHWHGLGEPTQHEYYRCEGCRAVVTWYRIRSGGCRCRESYRMRPAMLTWREKATLVLVPWALTPPATRRAALARAAVIAARIAAARDGRAADRAAVLG